MTNACTLGDLAVTCMDKLSCSKVYIPVKVAPLVDAKGVFMPGVEKIFEAWFERFADEELDGNMVMGDKGFNVFMRETTGSIHLDITKINQSKRQFTGGDTEYVTKEQFIKFYREKSKEKPDVVRANLRAHHIGNDLKSTQSQSGSFDPKETRDAAALPRHKLAFEEDQFERLFNLLEHHSLDDLWQLLTLIQVNPKIYF